MRGKLACVAAAMAFCAAAASAAVNEDGDWQVWLNAGVVHKEGNWRFKVEEEVYWGDDVSDLYYRHTDACVAYAIPGAQWLEAGAAFREIQKENGSKEWQEEYRPRLSADMKFAPGGWYVRGRSWLELRCKTYDEEKLRFRERILVGPPAKWFGDLIQPFLGDEVYIEEKDGFNKNRIYAGIEATIGKVKTTLTYILESSKLKNDPEDILEEDDPDDVNILQLKFLIEI